MRMLRWLTFTVVAGLSLTAWGKQPNILFIVAEDLSPRIGSFGDEIAKTPNIDALAEQGIRFTNVFAAAGVCAPNRSALISGMYPISLGTHQMRTSQLPLPNGKTGYETVTPAQMKAFPELLRRAGYETVNFAKKDYQFGTPSTLWDKDIGNYFSPLKADLWNELSGGKPFFAMINLMSTHEGHLLTEDGKAAEKFKGFTDLIKKDLARVQAVTDPASVTVPPYYPDTPVVRRSIAQHYDNIHYMDSQVGEILAALKQDGLDDNTIVVWTTDHGDALPRAKRSVYDTGLRIPLIVRFPDRRGAGTQDNKLISMVDFAPTFLSFAGAPLPDFLQGTGIFSGEQRDYIYAARDRMDMVPDKVRAVRDLRFKYIRNDMPELPYFRPLVFRDMFPVMIAWWEGLDKQSLNPAQQFYFEAPRPGDELYDTDNDPWETRNLADDPSQKARLSRMKKALKNWEVQVHDKSTEPETGMVGAMWPGFEQPVTASPQFKLTECNRQVCVAITSSSDNASVAWRMAAGEPWQLYTQPVPVQPNSYIEAKAVRYGYQESNVEQYHHD